MDQIFTLPPNSGQGAFSFCYCVGIMGKYMVNSKVLFLSDNQVVVEVLNKQSCKDKNLMRLIIERGNLVINLSKITNKFHECLYDREDLNKVIVKLFKLSAGVLVFPLGSDSAKEQLVWASKSGNETTCQLLC
jgi:hypothetical protein